jgi:hypothetical protein
MTLAWASAGRTAITSASHLACTRQGRPSQVWRSWPVRSEIAETDRPCLCNSHHQFLQIDHRTSSNVSQHAMVIRYETQLDVELDVRPAPARPQSGAAASPSDPPSRGSASSHAAAFGQHPHRLKSLAARGRSARLPRRPPGRVRSCLFATGRRGGRAGRRAGVVAADWARPRGGSPGVPDHCAILACAELRAGDQRRSRPRRSRDGVRRMDHAHGESRDGDDQGRCLNSRRRMSIFCFDYPVAPASGQRTLQGDSNERDQGRKQASRPFAPE